MNTSTTPRTQYGYASGSANTIRPTSLTYPSGRTLTYNYGTAGTLSDQASRVASIVDSDTTTLVSYEYLGRGSFVRAASPQPTLAWTLVGSTIDPDTGDIYTGLDRFGRVKDNRWLNTTTSTDVDRIQYGYDRASNRLWRHNVVATSNGQAFDELYTYDGVQRLKDMQRGTLNGTKTALTSSTFGQCWTLDSTGNWTGFREDSDGNGSWDLVQSRSANPVNEITTITNTTGPAWAQPAYDPNGNMTTIPRGGQAGAKNWSGLSLDDWSDLSLDNWSGMTVNATGGATSFTATYDAWNRLITLTDPESGAELQRNTYDARRFRIVREDLGQPPRHMYYTTGWQCLEERASTSPESATPDRQFVWGFRYIDDLILRDRDTDANGSLNERLYACQDGNWNVTAMVSSAGSVAERYAYSAYGVPIVLTPTFTDRAASLYELEHLYCGYRWDAVTSLYHVRHRSCSPLVGTWIQRDPAGYVDGLSAINMYNVINAVDPAGLACKVHYECYLLIGETDEDCLYKCVEMSVPSPEFIKGSGRDNELDCDTFRKIVGTTKPHEIYYGSKKSGCDCQSPTKTTVTRVWDKRGENCSISECKASCEAGSDSAERVCDWIKGDLKQAVCETLVARSKEYCKEMCALSCSRK